MKVKLSSRAVAGKALHGGHPALSPRALTSGYPASASEGFVSPKSCPGQPWAWPPVSTAYCSLLLSYRRLVA